MLLLKSSLSHPSSEHLIPSLVDPILTAQEETYLLQTLVAAIQRATGSSSCLCDELYFFAVAFFAVVIGRISL